MKLKFTSFETKVLQMLVAGDHPVLKSLRRQLDLASVANRTPTSNGSYTDIAIGFEAPRLLNVARWILGDIVVQIPGIEGVGKCGCTLYVKNGLLSRLECWTEGDVTWIEDPTSFSILYANPLENPTNGMDITKTRDLGHLIASMPK